MSTDPKIDRTQSHLDVCIWNIVRNKVDYPLKRECLPFQVVKGGRLSDSDYHRLESVPRHTFRSLSALPPEQPSIFWFVGIGNRRATCRLTNLSTKILVGLVTTSNEVLLLAVDGVIRSWGDDESSMMLSHVLLLLLPLNRLGLLRIDKDSEY